MGAGQNETGARSSFGFGGKDHINDTECGRFFRESAQMGVWGGVVSCISFLTYERRSLSFFPLERQVVSSAKSTENNVVAQ